jgi:hypothetical protein
VTTRLTRPDLVATLLPIADACLDHAQLDDADPVIVKASVVLAALMGGLEGRTAALDALAIQAGLICEHELGLHHG